jgi:flagellar basal body rod protein FlgB
MIHAKDDVTGATEFYEQFVTHDGSGSVSEITGTNVQSTPGNFLTTPAASISGANVVLALTNSALSGNAVSMKVEITAFAA